MIVRRSRFKHVFGKALKKESCYEDIRITHSSWDARFCSVNPKYVAIITEAAGGGAFLVLPIEKVGRVERDAPLVAGHKGSVLDIQWCPHNDDLIASASEDTTVKVWRIPEGGLQPNTNLTVPSADLVAHMRRAGLVVWHPTAEHVLLSAGADNMIFIWNVATETVMVEIKVPDMILSACFNFNGSKLATTCKDRTTRVFNPRTGDVLIEGVCHQGSKPQQVVYVSDDRLFTTGFSPSSARECAVWSDSDLSKPLVHNELDISNGVLFPFYDRDTDMIYLCGKGDSNIRYFELTNEEPYLYFLNTYSSSEPQRGMGWMPKRGLDVSQCEVARFYKLHTKGLCEVIPFTVPRRSELFQDDLYPDTVGDIPALTAEQWFGGQDADPILISMKEYYEANAKPKTRAGQLSATKAADRFGLPRRHQSAAQELQRPARRSPERKGTTETVSSSWGDSHQDANQTLDFDIDENDNGTANLAAENAKSISQMCKDLHKIKLIVKAHEQRIRFLEGKSEPKSQDTAPDAE